MFKDLYLCLGEESTYYLNIDYWVILLCDSIFSFDNENTLEDENTLRVFVLHEEHKPSQSS